MATNLHLIIGSDLDDATLTVTPAPVATLPATNMQTVDRGRVCRVLGNSMRIRSSFAAGRFASGFALARHNLALTGTIRLRLYDGADQTGTVTYDSGAVAIASIIPWGVMIPGVTPWGGAYPDGVNLPPIATLWFDTMPYRSLQVDITSPGNGATDALDVGRIFLGQAFVPEYNYNFGDPLEWVDHSRHTRTAGGSLRTEETHAYRRVTISLDWLNLGEREFLAGEFERRMTKAVDLLLSMNPEATGRTKLEGTMICKRVNDIALRHTTPQSNALQLILEEI